MKTTRRQILIGLTAAPFAGLAYAGAKSGSAPPLYPGLPFDASYFVLVRAMCDHAEIGRFDVEDGRLRPFHDDSYAIQLVSPRWNKAAEQIPAGHVGLNLFKTENDGAQVLIDRSFMGTHGTSTAFPKLGFEVMVMDYARMRTLDQHP